MILSKTVISPFAPLPSDSWSSYWATLWNGIGADVAVERQGSDYWLHQKISSELYWTLRLKSTTTGATTINSIMGSRISRPAVRVDQGAAGVTFGGTWVGTALANASSYGGTYARADVATSYVEYTTPAGATGIGMRSQFFTNSGVWLVTIDDDNTLANQCLTAQQMVTAGTLPDTVLAANGGTLNPTDRVLDGYNSSLFSTAVEGYEINTGFYKLLASGLAPGAHKVRLTATVYKNASSGGVRLIVDALYYTTTTMTGANWSIQETNLYPTNSVFEYAHTVRVGAGTQDFVGNTHGYDNQTALAIEVDGSVVAPDDQEVVVGSLLEITRTSSLKDIDAGTDIGESVTTYTLHPTNGLTIGWQITWAVELVAAATCYPAMFPTGPLLDRGANNAYASDVDLSANDGEYKARANGRYAYLWDADGVYGALFTVTDVDTATGGLVSELGHLFIEDRNEAGYLNKVYLLRAGGAVAVNDVWESEANYRVKIFADANASLAGIGVKS